MIYMCATCRKLRGFKLCRPLFAISHGMCGRCVAEAERELKKQRR